MKNEPINWDEVPDILSKEQIYKLCHISKETARFLLKSGLLPCKYSGKKTRCYQVAKADVQTYMEDCSKHPEKYIAPSGYYKGLCTRPRPRPALSEPLQNAMREYYQRVLAEYDDVLSSKQVSVLTGYKTYTITRWCQTGVMQGFLCKNQNMVPKIFLLDFLCSPYAYTIFRKSSWHAHTLGQITAAYEQSTRGGKK